MKICFVTHTVFSLGGIQRVVSVLANSLSESYDVEILCISDEFEINRELYNLNNKVNIHKCSDLYRKSTITKIICKFGMILNNRSGILNNKYMLKALKESYFPSEIRNKFINFFNKQNYDIIIGVEGIYSLLLSIISKELDAKTIGWQHNSYEAYFENRGKYCWKLDELFRRYIPELDEYVVLTDYDTDMLDKKMQINAIRIYNPLSFTSEKKSKCCNKNILFVGRLVERQKGLDLLIKAFKEVNTKRNDWRLTIVGDGPDKEKVLNLINKLNLQEVVEVVPFTNKVEEYYLNSSIFVSTSRWEGFGLVITEAMECGLPVVAFDNTGPREIINKNNENGILIPCENTRALSENILELINNKGKLITISTNSIERARDFNLENITKQWISLINNIKK